MSNPASSCKLQDAPPLRAPLLLITIHHALIALSLGVACLLWWREHIDAGRLGIGLLCWLWGLQQGIALVLKVYHWAGLKRSSGIHAGEPVSELSGVMYRYCPDKQQYCYLGSAAASALGVAYQPCQLTSKAFDAMVHPDDRESLKRARCLALRQGYFQHTYRLIHGAYEQRVLDRGIVLHRDGVAECHGLLMDISQLKEVGAASVDRNEKPAAPGGMSCAMSFSMVEALQHAMADRQLHLVYQPQVHAHDQRIAGFEVLLRWHHPDHGDIPPSSFVPVAESMGLMPSLLDHRRGVSADQWLARAGLSCTGGGHQCVRPAA